jgi:hypothetical protein
MSRTKSQKRQSEASLKEWLKQERPDMQVAKAVVNSEWAIDESQRVNESMPQQSKWK